LPRPELPAFEKPEASSSRGLPPGTVVNLIKKRSTPMFARILNFEVKPEKKEEFVKVLNKQVLPILTKQNGFLEILPFFPEKVRENKAFMISLWTTKQTAESYEREIYPQVFDIVKPYLTTPVVVNYYNLETTLCKHFVDALTA
jgi:quinol monooxygenase YgiN